MKLKIKNENELNNLLSCNNKLSKIEILTEILNKYIDVELFDESNNEIIIYDVDEYDVDEIFDNFKLNYEIIKIDPDCNEIYIKISDDEFKVKNEIENYDELIKYYTENNLINLISLDVIEFNELFNKIAMNDFYDYIHKFHFLTSNYYKYQLDNKNNIDVNLFNKFIKIFSHEFIDDVELYNDLDELYNDDIKFYKNYDVELFDESFIFINHNLKLIRNMNNNELYDLISKTINKYLKLNNNIEILHDEIIELLNIISYDYILKIHQDQLYKINLNYKYPDYKIKPMNQLINYIDEIDEIKYIFNYDDENIEIYDVELIDPDDIIELFNVDDVIEFIENNVEINYDHYNYDNYIALNNLFYRTFKNNHMKIND